MTTPAIITPDEAMAKFTERIPPVVFEQLNAMIAEEFDGTEFVLYLSDLEVRLRPFLFSHPLFEKFRFRWMEAAVEVIKKQPNWCVRTCPEHDDRGRTAYILTRNKK